MSLRGSATWAIFLLYHDIQSLPVKKYLFINGPFNSFFRLSTSRMEPALKVTAAKGKRPIALETDFSKCLVCQTNDDDKGPLNKLTNRGLPTFKNAVEVRKDTVHQRLWGDLQNADEFLSKIPILHRTCRSEYTHKKSLDDVISAKRSKDDHSSDGTSETAANGDRRSSMDFKKTLKDLCFLCEKERDSKGDRKLTLVSTKERQQSIHQKAKELNRKDILFKIDGYGDQCSDLIANDFRYHLRCMNKFMSERAQVETKAHDPSLHDQVFQHLLSEVSPGLMSDRHVYYVRQLCKRYDEMLKQHGSASERPYRTDRLMKRLLNHFGDKVQFITLYNKTLVCSSLLTTKEFCDEVVGLKADLDECQLLPDDECFDGVDGDFTFNVSGSSYPLAKHLQNETKQAAKSFSQAQGTSLEISYREAANQVPINLYNLLAWLITNCDETTGEDGKVHVAADDNEKVLNLAQDVMFYLSNQPLPKHIGVGLHILKQARSKNLITMMNRFGNGISYSTVQRYLTTVANDISDKEEREGIFIPTNIIPGHFTQFALDNLNFHSDTEDGGSLDATTNIVYQYRRLDDQQVGIVPVKKTRERGIKTPTDFEPVNTNLTLKDRKQARSLHDVEIGQGDEGNGSLADKNIVWFLFRMFPTQLMTSVEDSMTIPSLTWNSFFELNCGQDAKKTTIGYGPMYPKTPTRPDVVKTSLDYFVSMSLKLGQPKTVITCDQAIYDILKGLVVKEAERYKNVIVRLGGFHIAQNFLGSIGFFVKESGIEDLLVSSGICGRGTANKVIGGKDYYKMVRYHSWICEAMFMLKWESFEKWLAQNNEIETLAAVSSALENLRNACEMKDKQNVSAVIDEVKTKLATVDQLWKDFDRTLGLTARLWTMYIEIVLILKRFIHAERVGLWKEHLEEVQNMLPYVVSSGHSKYMSCLPIYLSEMNNLPLSAPDVHQEFMAGNFNVHVTEGCFNGVWTDLALEQTYNKEGKTLLFKGITQDDATREKYVKTLPFLTAASESVKEMVHMNCQHSDHHDKLTKEDLEKVLKIKFTVTAEMRDPFSDDSGLEKLINISTGEALPSTELLEAKKRGMEAMELARSTGAEKISVPKITTFASQHKKGKKKQDTVSKVTSEESAVTRALCFTQDLSDEDKIDAFSYEWLDFPPSLFEPAGHEFAMRKGTKADFLVTLQDTVGNSWMPLKKLPSEIPSGSIYLVDAMAFIQRFQTLGATTFGQLQESLKNKLLRMKPDGCHEVHFIGDRYDFGIHSLKEDERHRRTADITQSPEFIPADMVAIPAWKLFLSNPCNKTNLLSYLSSSWATATLPDGFHLVLGVTSDSIRITQNGVTVIQNLHCATHEEADTRIFAHIASCPNESCVIIHATDTDIVLLSLYHFPRLQNIKQLWVEKNDLFLPIHDLVKSLSDTMGKDPMKLTDSLLNCYVLSGCDSVSYPFRRGKKRAAKVALQHVDKMPAFSSFTTDSSLHTDELTSEARSFFCDLYGRGEYASLDKLRAHLFASSRRDLRSLPPTEDAFYYHVLRSLCQISLYKQATLCSPVLLPPEKYGRYVENDRLLPVLKTKPSKPAIAKLSFCKCKKTPLCLKNCPCAKAGVACIVACTCNGDIDKCGLMNAEDSDDDLE